MLNEKQLLLSVGYLCHNSRSNKYIYIYIIYFEKYIIFKKQVCYNIIIVEHFIGRYDYYNCACDEIITRYCGVNLLSRAREHSLKKSGLSSIALQPHACRLLLRYDFNSMQSLFKLRYTYILHNILACVCVLL